MKPHSRCRYTRCVAVAGLVALALVPAVPAARAEVARTGDEPWYRQAPADVRQRAQALFEQAVDKHRQLLRGDARDLYEQALALWDNPDIRWNLALLLDDLGQYLRAHEQLDSALRWRSALGDERLRQVRDRMRALETRRLARLEASTDEPGAEIKLDGKPWFRGPGTASALVLPGEHYITAGKPGYFPVTRSAAVSAGQQARVALQMDQDRLVETRRWEQWKPWAVLAAGGAAAAAGVVLESRALADVDETGDVAARACPDACSPIPAPGVFDRAVTENRLAIGALVVGGTAVAVGLALAWLNQPRAHRTEMRQPPPIELAPILSPGLAGVSARGRF